MDFFEHQAEAKRRTKQLVFYYALAVLLIIAAVYAVVVVGLIYSEAGEREPGEHLDVVFWRPMVMMWTALMVGGMIAAGTFFKTASLSAGGKSVAKMMGGRPVPADTKNPDERRLLNIVEEVAIASGTPVPPVYIIEEESINAFAAGFNPSDAVIGVTRGCMSKLNRDELQGVVAHEFSHILNGDMRLNIRLIGVLFGILLIAVVGRTIMYAAFYSGGARRRSSRGGKGGGGQIAIMIAGLSLIVIGSIGVFFGRLIKSAISRQREFLSDAAAVQFTRNPAGIAGALGKIQKYSSGIESVHAEEASHMFFANGLKSSLGGLLATHPPLAERIRRIDPKSAAEGDEDARGVRYGERQRRGPRSESPAAAGLAGPAAAPQLLTATIGTMSPEGLAYASAVMESLSDPLIQAARTPHGARAIVCCLLLSREKGPLHKQKACLQERLDEPTRSEVMRLVQEVRRLPVESRMPLVEVAMPALQQQGSDDYERFRQTVQALIAADNRVSIFEFALSRNLIRNLEPVFGRPEKVHVRYYGIKSLIPHCLPLLAMLAYYGNEDDPHQASEDYAAGLRQLGIDPGTQPIPDVEHDPVKTFEKSLNVLRQASGKVKQQVVNACAASVLGNRTVTVEESELLRAVADSLDCPMPPLTAGRSG